MAEYLYALQRDLDMVTQDVLWLKKSYNMLDYIAKVVRDSKLEQLAQAAQMRRMEEEMKIMREEMKIMKAEISEIKTELGQMKEEISQIKEEVSRIKDTLLLITKHLGIQSA